MQELNYSDFVAALAKPGDDILSSLTGNKCHLLHMAIGIVGEVGELYEPFIFSVAELDLENIEEELGDIEFFLEGLRQGYGIDRKETICSLGYPSADSTYILNRLSISSAHLLDATKKYVIYNKPLDVTKIVEYLKAIETDLASFRSHLELSRVAIVEKNKAKLSKRYAAGSYSDKQAQERADKQ